VRQLRKKQQKVNDNLFYQIKVCCSILILDLHIHNKCFLFWYFVVLEQKPFRNYWLVVKMHWFFDRFWWIWRKADLETFSKICINHIVFIYVKRKKHKSTDAIFYHFLKKSQKSPFPGKRMFWKINGICACIFLD
jgi:hypothetical protein